MMIDSATLSANLTRTLCWEKALLKWLESGTDSRCSSLSLSTRNDATYENDRCCSPGTVIRDDWHPRRSCGIAFG